MNVGLAPFSCRNEDKEDAVVMNADDDQVKSTQYFGAWLGLWVIWLGLSYDKSWFLWHGDRDSMQCREAAKKSASWKESANVGIWDVSQNRF